MAHNWHRILLYCMEWNRVLAQWPKQLQPVQRWETKVLLNVIWNHSSAVLVKISCTQTKNSQRSCCMSVLTNHMFRTFAELLSCSILRSPSHHCCMNSSGSVIFCCSAINFSCSCVSITSLVKLLSPSNSEHHRNINVFTYWGVKLRFFTKNGHPCTTTATHVPQQMHCWFVITSL